MKQSLFYQDIHKPPSLNGIRYTLKREGIHLKWKRYTFTGRFVACMGNGNVRHFVLDKINAYPERDYAEWAVTV